MRKTWDLHRRRPFLVECLEARNLLTVSGPQFLTDLTTTPDTTITNEVVRVGDTTLFVGGTAETGAELFTLDSSGELTLWMDLIPGPQSSDPSAFRVSPDGSYGLFKASLGRQAGIWHTDGVTAKPVLVQAGTESFHILEVTDVGAYVARDTEFAYLDDDDREELITDVWFVSAADGQLSFLQTFTANDDEAGVRFNSRATRDDGLMVFQHCVQEDDDCTVWRTDGTYQGTEKLLDILHDTRVEEVDGDIYIRDDAGDWLAYDGQNLRAATVAAPFQNGWLQAGSSFYGFPNGTTSDPQRELVVAAAIAGETQSLVDNIAWARGLWATDSSVFALMRRDDSSSSDELWVTDGTAEGTQLLLETQELDYARYLAHDADQIYLVIRDAGAQSVWASDGSNAGTSKIAEYDVAVDLAGRVDGDRVWIAQDSDVGRTFDVFRENTVDFSIDDSWQGTDGSGILKILEFGEQRVVQNYGGIWLTDVSLQKFTPLVDTMDSPTTSILATFVAGDNIWYSAAVRTSTFGSQTTLRLNQAGSPDGIGMEQLAPDLADRRFITGHAIGDQFVFGVNEPAGVWVSDGTPEGTTSLIDLPGTISRSAFRAEGGQVYFHSSVTPTEWWVTDGTIEGTVRTDAANVPSDEMVFNSNGFEYTVDYGRSFEYSHPDGRSDVIQGPTNSGTTLQVGHDVYYVGYEPLDEAYYLYRIVPGDSRSEPYVERYFDMPISSQTLERSDDDLVVLVHDAFYGSEPWRVPITHDLEFNYDHIVDCNDARELQTFASLTDPVPAMDQIKFDVNADSQLDAADLQEWVRRTGFGGDVNTNGVVNASDLNRIGGNWLQRVRGGWCDGDLDGDGQVGPADLNQVAIHWPSQSVARAPRAPLAARAAVALEPVFTDLTTPATDRSAFEEPLAANERQPFLEVDVVLARESFRKSDLVDHRRLVGQLDQPGDATDDAREALRDALLARGSQRLW